MTPRKPPTITVPSHLSAASQAYWTATQATFGIVDDSGLKLLTMACECLDSAELARLAVAQHGQTFVDRLGNVRPRPEVRIQRDAMLGFKALVRELRLDPLTPMEQKR